MEKMEVGRGKREVKKGMKGEEEVREEEEVKLQEITHVGISLFYW